MFSCFSFLGDSKYFDGCFPSSWSSGRPSTRSIGGSRAQQERFEEAVAAVKGCMDSADLREKIKLYTLMRQVISNPSASAREAFVLELLARLSLIRARCPHLRQGSSLSGPADFNAAVRDIMDKSIQAEFLVEAQEGRDLAGQMSNEEKLQLYALFHQGWKGDNRYDKPAFLDLVRRLKWEAWSKLRGMPRDTAWKKCIEHVKAMKKKYDWKPASLQNPPKEVEKTPALSALADVKRDPDTPSKDDSTLRPTVIPPQRRSFDMVRDASYPSSSPGGSIGKVLALTSDSSNSGRSSPAVSVAQRQARSNSITSMTDGRVVPEDRPQHTRKPSRNYTAPAIQPPLFSFTPPSLDI